MSKVLIKPWETIRCPNGHAVAIAVRPILDDQVPYENMHFVPLVEFPIGGSYCCPSCDLGVFHFLEQSRHALLVKYMRNHVKEKAAD